MKIFLGSIFIIVIISSCGSFNKILKSNDIDYKYKKAVSYFEAKRYNYVIQIFSPEFFPLLKGTKEFEEAFYMFAYSHYYEKDYFNAENLFKQYAEIFSTSKRVVEMEYMRAYTYYKQSPKVDLEQTNTLKTIGMMNTFINQHPDTEQAKEAAKIIDLCKEKLEEKDFKSAELYYRMGQYRAAAVSFLSMLNAFPESNQSDFYKYMAIKAYFQFAEFSIEEKKEERYEEVITECNDFLDKFGESKYTKEVEKYSENSTTNIKKIKNEQVKKTTSS